MPAGQQLLTGRRVVFALLLAAMAVVGFWAGRELRQWRAGPTRLETAAPPQPALSAGDPFPEASLVAPGGEAVTTAEILSGGGAAVLFLEPGCPACGESVGVWQSWIEAGELVAERVIGISRSDRDAVAEYRRTRGLTFPIYRDAEGTFRRDFGVVAVPLTVLVDSAGTIRRLGYEPAHELDVAEIVAATR